MDLYKLKGEIIAQGTNGIPVGLYQLKTYRIEELNLQKPINIEGMAAETDKAWRVTITGGPFHLRAMPAVIWIDDVIIGSGQENADLSAVSVIVFDRSLLREGAAIALSYGEDFKLRTELPEKLYFTD